MERYQTSKIAAQMHFPYLKNSDKKLRKNCNNTKNCQHLENGWKYRKILISALGASWYARCSTRNNYWFLNYINFLSQIGRYLR